MGIDRWRLPLPSLGVYSNSLGEAAEGALGTRSRAIRRFTSIACILLRLKRDVGKVADAFCVYHYRLEAYASLPLQAGSLCYFETGASRPRCWCMHGRDAHFTMRARRDISAPSPKSLGFRCVQNGSSARREEGAYLDRYVTDEQRSSRPIFNATLWAAAGWLFFALLARPL